jgi:hypothetical protein
MSGLSPWQTAHRLGLTTAGRPVPAPGLTTRHLDHATALAKARGARPHILGARSPGARLSSPEGAAHES